MSKFTKALEKIQHDREEPKDNGVKKPVSTLKLPSMEEMNEKLPFLERIPVVKNSVADNRIVMLRFPDSMIAEQYRMLRTSLKTQLAKETAKVILISSSVHSEGKTLSASNLAVSLAENGDAKVLLIDADLRRGKVGDYFNLGKGRLGLSEFLSEETLSPRQIMVRGALKNLYIIPRGAIAKKPQDLVGSNKFHLLVAELRAHFDYIIIDAPPIMSVADAGILARESDGVLFIIQVGRTPKSVIAHSHLLFKQSGVKMLGYILTNVEFQSADYKYYNTYYAYGQELDQKQGFRAKTKVHLKKAGWGLKSFEDRFNHWWDKSVLKKTNGRHAKVEETISDFEETVTAEK